MKMGRFSAILGCKRKKGDQRMEDACDAKNEYMIRNGALLLQKQILLGIGKGSGSNPLRIFSSDEITRSTNDYDHRLILGRNVATGYRGALEDGRGVAIKSPRGLIPTDEHIDFFLHQAAINQIVNHRNVIKLHGCCLETRVPTLVFEFLPNGRLIDHIKGKARGSSISNSIASFNIPWSGLLRIAADMSYALSYMHIALPKPVIHMNVKPASIFLDESFNAKLGNFGYAVSISPGEDFISESVVGTKGYIDPEYQVTRKVTEKCDVYSFGVTLIVLLTGMSAKTEENLVRNFTCLWEQGDGFLGIVHPRVLREAADAGEIQAFAGLAMRCIVSRGVERPTMREVAIEQPSSCSSRYISHGS